ncbi:MAG: SUMF1/EgtB/PvdO family nonheme iron enzyme [Bacteroidia bacterium]|nr:SUMF1/EgtB/PvdO family nonheme iron enzyme [Bacteroidia bacterium]
MSISTRPAPLTLATLQDHMVWVEGGVFEMGSDESSDEQPIHRIQIDSFFLCRYLVTQEIWESITATNPSAFPHPQRPVEQVSWYDCIRFCNDLSDVMGLQFAYQIHQNTRDPGNNHDYGNIRCHVIPVDGANGYRLPTEAEWEYAAKDGVYFLPGKSYNFHEISWWKPNCHSTTQPVGIKYPNRLGLFDMSGNVQEWVWDWYDSYYRSFDQDNIFYNPLGPVSGARRGARGGAWNTDSNQGLRAAYRDNPYPSNHSNNIGFRLCRSAAASDFTR